MFKKLADALPHFSSPKNATSPLERRKRSARYGKSSNDDVFDFLELIERWEEIIGPKLAKVTIPLKNQGNTLTILTNHSAYSQALSYMEETLRIKLYNAFPSLQGKIKKLKFIVNTTHFEKQKRDLEKRANLEKKRYCPKEKAKSPPSAKPTL